MPGLRMRAEERRQAILKAALALFAEQGFAQTTTRQLAQAAGVSEALLYKHFPSKDSLYAEIQRLCGCGTQPDLHRIARLKPSTSTLVHLVHHMVRSLAMGGHPREAWQWQARHRLLLHGCLENGQFPAGILQEHCQCWLPKLQDSLQAAEQAGDVVKTPVTGSIRLLLAHHLGTMLGVLHLPTKGVVQYGVAREELVTMTTWFVLRGMGLTDQALMAHLKVGRKNGDLG